MWHVFTQLCDTFWLPCYFSAHQPFSTICIVLQKTPASAAKKSDWTILRKRNTNRKQPICVLFPQNQLFPTLSHRILHNSWTQHNTLFFFGFLFKIEYLLKTKSYFGINILEYALCQTYKCDMSHAWMGHVSLVNVLFYTHRWVMSHSWTQYLNLLCARHENAFSWA